MPTKNAFPNPRGFWPSRRDVQRTGYLPHIRTQKRTGHVPITEYFEELSGHDINQSGGNRTQTGVDEGLLKKHLAPKWDVRRGMLLIMLTIVT